jgi:hypothetical protein
MTTAAPKLILYDFPASTGIAGWESFSPFVLEVCRALRLAKLPFELKLDALEVRAPDGGFWLGPRLGVADLGLFAHLHSLRLPLTPWQAEEVAKRPRLTRYLDRVDAETRGD